MASGPLLTLALFVSSLSLTIPFCRCYLRKKRVFVIYYHEIYVFVTYYREIYVFVTYYREIYVFVIYYVP